MNAIQEAKNHKSVTNAAKMYIIPVCTFEIKIWTSMKRISGEMPL